MHSADAVDRLEMMLRAAQNAVLNRYILKCCLVFLGLGFSVDLQVSHFKFEINPATCIAVCLLRI